MLDVSVLALKTCRKSRVHKNDLESHRLSMEFQIFWKIPGIFWTSSVATSMCITSSLVLSIRVSYSKPYVRWLSRPMHQPCENALNSCTLQHYLLHQERISDPALLCDSKSPGCILFLQGRTKSCRCHGVKLELAPPAFKVKLSFLTAHKCCI